jgi:hypothetical protein
VDGRPLVCSSIIFTRPLSNSLHHLHTSHYHHTLSLAYDEFQQLERFLLIKSKWQNTFLLLSTLSVLVILKLLLWLFTSPEAVTVTAVWWRIYVVTEPMLGNSLQESF